MAKSLDLKTDILVLDLEDGVPADLESKEKARQLVSEQIKKLRQSSVFSGELAVRINSLESGLLERDLAVLAGNKALFDLDLIILPKTQSDYDLHYLQRQLEMHNQTANGIGQTVQGIGIFACMESARSLSQLARIAEVGSSRFNVKALVYSAEDFCADTGILRSPSRKELLYSRSALVALAKAWNLDAIDMVCLDFRNEAILREESLEAIQMGFTGKQAIHPAQLAPINEIFAPSESQVSRAREIVQKYQELTTAAASAGTNRIGAFDYQGKVIDLPVVKLMQKILDRHNQIQQK